MWLGYLLFALLPVSRAPAPAAVPAKPAWKTIDLVTAVCGSAPPGTLTFRIPPGYLVRSSPKGLTAGCLWGSSKDLALVLGESEATFDRVESGVFQSRLTTTVGFDPASGKFTDEDSLAGLFERAGVGGVAVSRRTVAGAPALVVTGRAPNGTPLYLLYLALASALGKDEGPVDVLLVRFHAPVEHVPESTETWRRFLASIRSGSAR